MDYVVNSVTVSIGEDLLPNYPLKNRYKVVEEYLYIEEESEESKESERKKQETREKNFSKGVDIFKNFQYLDIHSLVDEQSGWAYFDKPNPYQYLNLMSSVQTLGILNPLIVRKLPDDKYEILCGHSRAHVLNELFSHTKNERFLYAPCFVIEEEIEEYFIRSMLIDSNLNYRTISRETYVKAIFERFELLQRTKKYRNELNLAQALADEFGVSKATINNYLTLKKLCNEALTVVCNKELNLSSAKQLAKFNHEDQLYILEHTSLENLNEQFKVRLLTKYIDVENPSQRDLDMKMNTLERIVPGTTPVRVDISKDSLVDFLNVVIDFKKTDLKRFSLENDRKYIKKNFRVTLKESDMKLYKSKGIIDDELIQKVCSTDFIEIMRA